MISSEYLEEKESRGRTVVTHDGEKEGEDDDSSEDMSEGITLVGVVGAFVRSVVEKVRSVA